MEYSDIISTEQKLAIKFKIGTLNVVYDKSFFIEENNTIPLPKETMTDFCTRLLSNGLLIDWDLTVKGEKIPVSEEGIKQVQAFLRQEIYMAIQKDAMKFDLE